MNDQSPRIDGYGAHVYYDADSRATAGQLAKTVTDKFAVELGDDSVRDHDTDGAWLDKPMPLKLHVLSRAYRPELLLSA